MRDYFDIDALAMSLAFEGRTLMEALRSTFERRRTPIPARLPIGLTTEFSMLPDKRAQWSGFLRRNRLVGAPSEVSEVVERLAVFLAPLFEALHRGTAFDSHWAAGGGWTR